MLTRENHLGSIFQLAPQKASDLMIRLIGFQRGKSYGSYVNSLPVKEFETDAEYTWDAVASSARNIPLKACSVTTGKVGANGATFELTFGEDWFAK